ncbi:MAG TPA: hypothetical protein VFU90_11925, partial [Candidatus Tumulicola sp.]|nr:hypothetical protein [Candidatus Tumulicola sp.]
MTAHRMLESFAARFDVSALEEDEATMVAVDAAGTIAWTNRAWAEFAKANGGETVLARFTVGTSYLDGISGQTRSFYES